ncbi:MAG: hypothetical protein R6X27_05605 [Candidatus Desulfacyla sp.]
MLLPLFHTYDIAVFYKYTLPNQSFIFHPEYQTDIVDTLCCEYGYVMRVPVGPNKNTPHRYLRQKGFYLFQGHKAAVYHHPLALSAGGDGESASGITVTP